MVADGRAHPILFFKSVTESLDLESHFKNHNKNQKSVGSA